MSTKQNVDTKIRKNPHGSIVAIGDQGLVWRFKPNDIPGLSNIMPVFVPIKDHARAKRIRW